jgi:hypothetical protein
MNKKLKNNNNNNDELKPKKFRLNEYYNDGRNLHNNKTWLDWVEESVVQVRFKGRYSYS